MDYTARPTGDELRALRDEHRLTQEQVASAMKGRATQQYVSLIEGKASVNPKTADRYRDAVYAYTSRAKAS